MMPRMGSLNFTCPFCAWSAPNDPSSRPLYSKHLSECTAYSYRPDVEIEVEVECYTCRQTYVPTIAHPDIRKRFCPDCTRINPKLVEEEVLFDQLAGPLKTEDPRLW